MTAYVALLRAVNVCGTGKLPMPNCSSTTAMAWPVRACASPSQQTEPAATSTP